MNRESFIFYKSFYEASKFLENEEKGKLFDMICQYGLYGNEIEGEGASMGMFLLIKPQLDANNKRYINGCKGGAPEGNKNAVKTWKNNTKQPKNNQKQPNDNDNVNDNVKENNNENQKQENTQEHLNSFPKQDIVDDAHHSGCDLTNYNFDTFWKEFPHARKGKKKESEQYFNKQDAELVKKQVGILNFKIDAGLQDAQFIPACERRIRDFTPISDVVLKQELLKIAKRHLNAGGDIKERAKKLKETFGEDAINEAVKTIQQKDSPKNLFLNK